MRVTLGDEGVLFGLTLTALLLASGLGIVISDTPTPSTPAADAEGQYNVTDDGVRYTIHPSKLLQGCPGGKDCIPSIDDPEFQSAAEATWLEAEDRVIGVEIDGEARAYPLRILNVHEIVNDRLAGSPIAVTYCPLCRSGLVFSRRVRSATLTFGVSGKLHDANLIMYDRQTETYWSQLRGSAVVGTLVPQELELIPSSITTWTEWRQVHPETTVLSRDTGIFPPSTYGLNPYGGYGDSADVGYGVGEVDDRLPEKELVHGVAIGGTSVAYREDVIRERELIHDTIEDVPIVLLEDPRDGSIKVYIRTVDNDTLQFEPTDEGLVDGANTTWSYDGTALEGSHEGTQLQRIETHGFYWFAWQSVHPDTDVYGANESG